MPASVSASSLWNSVKKELQTLFPPDVFGMWFEPLHCLHMSDETLTLGIQNDFAAIWIQDNYMDLLNRQVALAAGSKLTVRLQVVEAENPEPDRAEETAGGNRLATGGNGRTDAARYPREGMNGRDRQQFGTRNSLDGYLINPRNTFDTFVVGQGNQLAHAACIAVANAPARAYNPLFLYGDTGLGKTHLMHSVAHQAIQHNPDLRVAYVTSEKFTNEFIHAIRDQKLVKFRQRYRSVDILLIDDIHFLAGKESTQEEFFHTFNDLFESGRQIIITSDRPASEISALESRLVSRFQWGLVTDIQMPEYETRLAILRKKAAALNIEIDEGVFQFLAKRVSRNVRRMEGALTRVASYRTLAGKPVTVDTCEEILKDILHEEAQNQITIEKIQKKVADYYKLQLADMVSKRRPAKIAFPRQIAMHLSRMLTNHSLQEIGRGFGGRDHGTVIHACKTVENIMEQDADVRRAVDYLTKQLAQAEA
ncbi:MAG: chromosomal replication initiator protein DnaA [Opitutales bacterium]